MTTIFVAVAVNLAVAVSVAVAVGFIDLAATILTHPEIEWSPLCRIFFSLYFK